MPDPAPDENETPATSIPVENFQSGKHVLNEWLPLLENGVIVATGATTPERQQFLCKQWLPIKLDATARDVLKNCTKDDWEELKVELQSLLIDPHEKYKWRINKNSIKWDGKESFHALATRVKNAVMIHEKQANWEDEFFFRFRAALPQIYRQEIDLGCDEDAMSIDNAKKIALRLQTSLADQGPAVAQSSAGTAGASAAAVFHDDLDALEVSFKACRLQMNELQSELQQLNIYSFSDRHHDDDHARRPPRDREGRHDGRHPHGPHDNRQSSSDSDDDERHPRRRRNDRGRHDGRHPRDYVDNHRPRDHAKRHSQYSSRHYNDRQRDYDDRHRNYDDRHRDYDDRHRDYDSRHRDYDGRSRDYDNRSRCYDSRRDDDRSHRYNNHRGNSDSSSDDD